MNFEPLFWNPWLWPVLAATCAGEAALQALGQPMAGDLQPEPMGSEPAWTTQHEIRLDLPTLRVREFSASTGGAPTLIVAPFALHGATLADFAPGHSLVECLLGSGLAGVCVVECKSATGPMRFMSIDNYLADLAVAIQDFGRPVSLIGLCQGGWLSLMLAARFPNMIRSVVLAGAPIDLDAAPSGLVAGARSVPTEIIETLVRSGGGLILGRRMLDVWGVPTPDPAAAAQVLQVGRRTVADLFERYRQWHGWAIDLPGTFYLQVVEQLFRRNELARGQFRALGRVADLACVKAPLFLLAGESDDVTPTAQLLSVQRLVGTPSRHIRTTVARCGHLSLFMGARTLRREWHRIAKDLQSLGP